MANDLFDLFDFQEQYAISTNRILRRPGLLRDRLNPLESFDEVDFFNRFRVTKDGFTRILERVDCLLPTYRKSTNSPLNHTQQLSVSLRYFATGDFQISCGDFQGISQPTVCRIMHRVTDAIASLSREVIKFPDDVSETNSHFFDYCGLPGISGIIDGSHIPIRSPGGPDAELFRNRKGFFSFNAQIICDHKLLIIDVVSGWPGSTHDSRVFNNSRICTEFCSGIREGILLGDSAYPLSPYLITPYPHPPNSRSKGRFNRALCKARCSIERCIGVLKRRWACLSRQLNCKHTRVPNIIVACSVLHNLCIMYHQPMVEEMVGSTVSISQDEDEQSPQYDDVEYRPGEDFLFGGDEVRDMLSERFE